MIFFLDIDHPFLAASPDYLNLALVMGNEYPLHIKCCKCIFVNANLFRKTEPPTLKHGAYYDQIQGQI